MEFDKDKNMKIIIATGGTGGHLFPALLVADKLMKENHSVLLVGSFSVAIEQVERRGFEYKNLKARGVKFNGIGESLVSMGLMARAVFQSLKIINDYKPDGILGFGGYGAFPVVLAARILGYPSMIHEQNVAPGRANAFLGKIVDKIAVSFQEAKKHFNLKKVIVTGCPCHEMDTVIDEQTVLNFLGFKERKFTIFVFGGSQGSEIINEVFVESVSLLLKSKDFQIIHITGEKDFDKIKEKYASLGVVCSVFKFLDKIEYAYSLADIVISRSGAVTIAEIISAKVPSILIPYPYAYGDHQKHNADVLTDKRLAITIEQKDLSKDSLVKALLVNFNNIKSCKNRDEVFADISYTDSSDHLAKEILKLKSERK